MNYLRTFFIMLVLVLLFSCSRQKNEQVYNEANYVKVKQGADTEYPNYPYVITYHYKADSNYSIRMIYYDSAYSQLVSKSFFYKGIPDGPFFGYVDGKITEKGYFKYGRLDGEKVSYMYGKIFRRRHFRNGTNVGVWEEYDKKGKLIRKTTYDDNGNVVEDKKF